MYSIFTFLCYYKIGDGMKEYTILGEFEHNNNIYELLLDEDGKYFFLRKNFYKEEYITIKELYELAKLFKDEKPSLAIEKEKGKTKKVKLVPKVIIGTLLVSLSLPILNFLTKISTPPLKTSTAVTTQSNVNNNENLSTMISHASAEEKTPTDKAIEKALKDIAKEEGRFELIGKLELFNTTIYYDSSEYDELFHKKKEDVTYDTIREDIRNNPNIPDKFKELYITLANNLEKLFPTLDLRVWDHNLQTIKILEVDPIDMKFKAISYSASACYRKDENVIYTVKGYDYVPGTWDYQVIMHEMCHPIKGTMIQDGKNKINVNFNTTSGHGVVIEEAMNSIFSVRSYDSEERDIAYQLQSNMVGIMLECMDNYTLQDYIEHDIRYFESKLNEHNGDDQAIRIVGLIELQYHDYHNDRIKVEQTQFHEVYDYIARMYYRKYIKPGMSYEQALEVHRAFIDKISFDVPQEYELDITHMDEYFEHYIQELGIKSNKTI